MLYAYASDFITAKTTYCFSAPVPYFQLLAFPHYTVITTVSSQVLHFRPVPGTQVDHDKAGRGV